MTPRPLAGVRVLDFCWMIAGPLTTRLLADMGAEVIKVESMARLDRIREVGVQPPTPHAETNGVFNDCNTNKKSILLNLNHARGIQLAKELAAVSDVVTSNFTPDRMDRWGLGYRHLSEVRPGIIVASMPVMGSEGPHNHWRAVGNGVIAMSGLNAHTGYPDRAPVGLGTLHSDFTSPYFGALAICAALHHRNKTGEGQFIELAQYEATVHLLDTEPLEYLVNRHDPPRKGNRSNRYAPHGVYRCAGADRWIAIAIETHNQWLNLCRVLGLEGLTARPGLNTPAGRLAAADEIDRAIETKTAGMDDWALARALQAAGVPASPVENVGDLVGRDPMGKSLFQEIDHPAGVSMLLHHEPVTWNGERYPIERAPFLGEHTAGVLGELLGLDEHALADLAAEGVLS
ncbi:MAG: CoA transferase [Dehalococcoidia bacterium]|nr:CoA transferase [Dehalococcoidia bacterium]